GLPHFTYSCLIVAFRGTIFFAGVYTHQKSNCKECKWHISVHDNILIKIGNNTSADTIFLWVRSSISAIHRITEETRDYRQLDIVKLEGDDH
ncbi:MAG: hypothetical protein WA364_23295, partial [Candidatus Nitrosopolaris sp.]